MSLVHRVKQAARIRRLKRAVVRYPTPQAYSDLAELHIQRGFTGEAHRIAREGLDLFPNARRLLQVSRFAKLQGLQERIRLLEETLRGRPHPAAFTELAGMYGELGDTDRAEEVCRRCSEAFPNNENPYLIVGELRLERFLDEGITQDGRIAVQNLERVAALNHNNVKCHLLLARLLHAAGALQRCCSHLRAMLSITPTAREIREFLTELEGRLARAPAGEEEHIESLLEEIQQTGRFANDPDEFPAVKGVRSSRSEGRIDMEDLREGMSQMARARGVRRAVVLDTEGEVLLEAGGVAQPARSKFTTLVKSLGQHAFDLSRRMDIGTLQRADIEGPFGVLRLVRLPGVTCCVLGETAKCASKAMDDFVAFSFAARKVEDHA